MSNVKSLPENVTKRSSYLTFLVSRSQVQLTTNKLAVAHAPHAHRISSQTVCSGEVI